MALRIGRLKRKDYRKAIQFAAKGMHFDWYTQKRLLLYLYGKYFWNLELSRATQVIAAYEGEELEGVLLARIEGEQRQASSWGRRLYVKLFDLLQGTLAGNGAGVYDEANREMLEQYHRENSSDGEILFLAVNPERKARGVGSLLLREFEQREMGKKIYLYTDNGCTYQFYEHRGFKRAGERNIVLDIGGRKIPLQCLLYSKEIGT